MNALRLPQRRRRAAWAIAVAGPTLITLGSRLLRSSVPPASALFSILLVVVVVALVGGWRPALTAVVVGLVAQEVLFTFPYGSLTNRQPAQVSVLVVFVVIGAGIGILVDEATVAIENIHTHLARKKPANRAVVDSIGLDIGYSDSLDSTPPLITQVGAVKTTAGPFTAFMRVTDAGSGFGPASGLNRVAVL